jgi:cytochrome c5
MGGVSFKTYADTVDGTIVVAGDPGNSLLVQVQQAGGHPAQLTPADLDRVIAWIKAGAPESGGTGTGPTPTPAASATTWSDVEKILTVECTACHINAARGNLSLKTYAAALQGGRSGPAIVPGNSAKSTIVQVQQKGGHPGTLSTTELATIIAWIDAGAPETAAAGGTTGTATPAPASTVKNWAAAEAIFTAKCAMCHINSEAGNLSLKTYAAALKGGKSGPGLVAGNPDKSSVVQVQQKGGHPGMLSAAELASIIEWITAGAPEK